MTYEIILCVQDKNGNGNDKYFYIEVNNSEQVKLLERLKKASNGSFSFMKHGVCQKKDCKNYINKKNYPLDVFFNHCKLKYIIDSDRCILNNYKSYEKKTNNN